MASTINSDETASCLWRWPKEYSDKPQPQDHLADLLQAKDRKGEARDRSLRRRRAEARFRAGGVAHRRQAGALTTAGLAKLHFGSYEEAAAGCRRAIEAYRNFPLPNFYLAVASLNLARTDEAQSAVKAGLALNKTYHRALGAGASA
jgi:tetratricopeptide (TPR) repeat protein